MELLKKLNLPSDIRDLNVNELKTLSAEVRERIIDVVTQNGGHIGASLGTVEMIVAMLKVFDAETDNFIFDVGHQAYAYKILTGRNEAFSSLRKRGGISGFPMPKESRYDHYSGGHAGNAVSAGCGFAIARKLSGEAGEIISIIGDGVTVNGETAEGLNLVSGCGKQIIIINDNTYSISASVGSVPTYLEKLRSTAFDGNLRSDGDSPFKQYDLDYIGAVDGHDISMLISAFELARANTRGVIIHIVTSKGKGYLPAETNPLKMHGVPPKGESDISTFSMQLGISLTEMRKKDDKVVAIAAAMANSTGLDYFINQYPDSFIDVGIAESTAITVAAALARKGYKPYVAIYSTFLQRAYDQLLHDIGQDNLNVTLCVDRAGIVGEDGESHQGIYDVAFLSTIPNIVIGAPKDNRELADMLDWTLCDNGLKAIRYPRGGVDNSLCSGGADFPHWSVLAEGNAPKVIIASGARMARECLAAREILLKTGQNITVINARFIKPVDTALLSRFSNDTTFYVVEDYVYSNSLSMNISVLGYRVVPITLPDCYLPFGKISDLLVENGLDAKSIALRLAQ